MSLDIKMMFVNFEGNWVIFRGHSVCTLWKLCVFMLIYVCSWKFRNHIK